MKSGIDLRALKAFVTVVRTGTVTAAGRQLNLTQPTTSRLLATLEKSIGFALFHRDRGRLIPTADAMLLFEEAELALGSIGHVRDLIEDISKFRVGRLRLVAPPSFSEGVLPEVIAGFIKRFPEVHLSIDTRSVETAKTMIATRAVDAGFLKTPVERNDLTAEPVVSSGSVCVLSRKNSLSRQDYLDPERLRGEPLILLGQGRQSRAQIETAFAEAGVEPHTRIDTHTIGSACGFAAQGVGVTIVNALLARPYLKGDLVALPFKPDLRHEYAFVTASVPGPTRLALEFLTETKQWFADLQSNKDSSSSQIARKTPTPSRMRSG